MTPARRRDGVAAHPEAVLALDGVTRRFGDVIAVDDVDLTVHNGELFSLLGGSGCGKTTLLRMIAGFELPDSGRIIINGRDMTDVPPYERPVNMVFQSYALFPHMTVAHNVAYGLRQEGMARSERDDRVAEVLALVDLSGVAKRKPDQLSGAQRQRVA
ncbi:MAG: ABC transporter ATP-binding protein, partial [Proteobacteria bacterium]|nr:ABC transporter ATP-binding protein [Pseudomonadota bacterium]